MMCAVLGAGIAIAVFFYVRDEISAVRLNVETQLSAVADLKARQISEWRSERINDARFFSNARFVAKDIRAFLDDPSSDSAKVELIHWLTLLKGGDRYERASVFDAGGNLLLMLPQDGDPTGPVKSGHVAEVLRDKAIHFTDIHRGDEGDIHMNIAFPIIEPGGGESGPGGGQGALIAIILLELDPGSYLYPLIQAWPTPSRTAETLLARREGDEVLFLNELRHRRGAALSLRLPVSGEICAAARGARGEFGLSRGLDYRGVPVLSAVRKVPRSPWFIVSKMDEKEAYAPMRERARMTGLAAAALALAAWMAVAAGWRGRNAKLLRRALKAEKDRADVAERLVRVVETAPDGIVMLDGEGRITFANRTAEKVLGLSRDGITARIYNDPAWKIAAIDGGPFSPDELPFARVMATGRSVTGVEHAIEHPDGRRVLLSINAGPLIGEGGSVAGVVASVADITDRKRVAEELKTVAREWRVTFDAMGEAICLLAPDGTIQRANKAFRKLVGVSWEALIGRNCHRLLHGEAPPADCPMVRALASKHRETAVMPLGDRWFKVTADPVTGDSGEILSIVHTMEDMTVRRSIEERQTMLTAAVEQAAESVVITDPHGTILYVNPAFERVTGYSRKEAQGKNPRILKSGRQDAAFYEKMWAAIAGGDVWSGRFVNRRKDGSLYDEEAVISPIRDASGAIVSFVGVKRDVTEEMAAEASLRDSEERYRELFESSGDAIMTLVPPDWNFSSVNPATLKVFGVAEASELVGKSPKRFVSRMQPDGRLSEGEFDEVIRMALDEGSRSVEWLCMRRDGATFPALVSLVRMSIGGRILLQATVRDVTGEKLAEQQRQQTQRLQSLGTLAGGIAHDLNNILTPILMGAQVLRDAQLTDEQREVVSMMDASAKRGAGVIGQILTFARGSEGTRGALQSRHLINEVLAMVKETFPRSIAVRQDLDQMLWPVIGNSTQLHQVLLNLLINARDAMPDGGTLDVRAVNRRLDEDGAISAGLERAGPYVVWIVKDTGLGISPEVMPRIFDPFFTTKEPGKGTGLGLSTVHGIVKAHEGAIRVESAVGTGTTFEVLLPAQEGPEDVGDGKSAEPSAGRGELVLVVDDEPSVRRTIQMFLEAGGYRVVTGASGVDAVAVCAEKRDAVKVIVLDAMMPEMGGEAALRVIRKMMPRIPVVAMSGLTEGFALNEDDVTLFLEKPFGRAELLAALRALLDKTTA